MIKRPLSSHKNESDSPSSPSSPSLSSSPSSSILTAPKIANSIGELIGRTPLLRLSRLSLPSPSSSSPPPLYGDVLLKLESCEPCNSVKDRIALAMIDGAEERGEISPGKTVLVEPTSGNTGIGLAMICASRGYTLILTMPSGMTQERRVLLRALGAHLVLTPAERGMKGAVAKAQQIRDHFGSAGRILDQFSNPDNPKVHERTTGPEIWEQTDGKVDIIIAGVGTGGTITGSSRYLKNQKSDIKAIAVEPQESPVLSGGSPGPHVIQGIGAGFIPDNFDKSVVDEVIQVDGPTAIAVAKELALKEGVFVGISSGAITAAALRVASREENKGKIIVAVLPSFGERYLSSVMFRDLQKAAAEQRIEAVDDPLDEELLRSVSVALEKGKEE